MQIEKFLCCSKNEDGWDCFVDVGNAVIHVYTRGDKTTCYAMPSIENYLTQNPYFLMDATQNVPVGMQKAVRVILNNEEKYKIVWPGGKIEIQDNYFALKEAEKNAEQ